VIDTVTGVATAVGGEGAFVLEGTNFGFDFNPTVDRIRVTSDANQNLRLNPINGALVAEDTPLAYAVGDANEGTEPNVVGSAYLNSFAGAQSTALYNIDSNLDVLVFQNPPNAGTLNTIGPLGVNTSGLVGFDISPATNVAFAYLTVEQTPAGDGTVAPTTGLYTINLTTGQATLIGPVSTTVRAANENVVDIAVAGATRLLNISTRGRVGVGEDVLIGGFILRGANNSNVLIRALGPSLANAGVNAPLADPVLTLFDGNGAVIRTNDDWQQAPNAAQVTAVGGAPTNAAEAAILISLPPGSFTAHVTGKDGATGVALVEVFQPP
jgi:hypothetical protein